MKNQTNKPKAVLISDLHFTVNTLELASKALILAINKALELKVPLIIAGDTLDSKAIMRAECVNRLLGIFEYAPYNPTYILVGNHDLLNEKGSAHSLEFLKPHITVVEAPLMLESINTTLLPYYNDQEALKRQLALIPSKSTIICHQGLQTAYMGHYSQDKTSLPPEAFADFRTISGHYHRAQDIKCGRAHKNAVGLFSYIGTAYTTSFAEANDGPKGFKILYDNGLLELVPTNLRKHCVFELDYKDLSTATFNVNPGDLIWLKLKGDKSDLDAIDKQVLGQQLFDTSDYKLDLIPNVATEIGAEEVKITSEIDLFDSLIDNVSDTPERKAYLKTLWRELLSENP